MNYKSNCYVNVSRIIEKKNNVTIRGWYWQGNRTMICGLIKCHEHVTNGGKLKLMEKVDSLCILMNSWKL